MYTITNFSGYMLSNINDYKNGDQWWPYDTEVFVCMDIDTAQRVLKQDNFFYVVIYHVTGRNIQVHKTTPGFYWTNQASKIYVDKPVGFLKPLSIQHQIKNAKIISTRTKFFDLVNGR